MLKHFPARTLIKTGNFRENENPNAPQIRVKRTSAIGLKGTLA
jgi:hypothetical protein